MTLFVVSMVLHNKQKGRSIQSSPLSILGNLNIFNYINLLI